MSRFFVGLLVAVCLISLTGNVLQYLHFSRTRPLVTVGSEVVRKGDYQDALDNQSGKAVLNKLVYTKLVMQAAAKAGVTPTAKDVDSSIADIRRRAPQLLTAADADTTKMAELRENLIFNLALENLRMRGISANDQEVSSYYAAHRQALALPPVYDTVISQNAVDAATAENLLRQKMPLDVIARQPGLAVVGVHGCAINWQKLPPATTRQIQQTVLAMPSNGLKTLHISKYYLTFNIEGSGGTTVPTLDAVRPQITRLIKLQKAPSAQDELVTLYQAAAPKFDVPKYASYFQDIQQAVAAHKVASAR